VADREPHCALAIFKDKDKIFFKIAERKLKDMKQLQTMLAGIVAAVHAADAGNRRRAWWAERFAALLRCCWPRRAT
jgi:hypothetical protein